MRDEEIISTLEKAYFGEKPHEASEIEALPKYIEGFSRFFDIGASLGQYTKALNNICVGATITCIEPDPVRFSRLKENCEQWSAEGRNKIVPLWGVVSEFSGKVPFFVTDSNVSGGLNIVERNARQWREIEVPSYRLDDLMEAESGNFIKVDVEGAEYAVVRGAPRVLSGDNAFLMELHPWGGGGYFPEHVLFLLKRHGYGFLPVHNHFLFKKHSGRRGIMIVLEACRFRLFRWIGNIVRFGKKSFG